MPEWLSKLAQEWAVISSAPISFITVTVIIGLVAWYLVSWIYATQLSNKDSEIVLLTRQRDDYRDKLQGASPDEAKARIDALESQLSTYIKANAPRRLTPTQRAIISKCKLPPIPAEAKITVGYDMGVPDGNRLAADFSTAFKNAGWAVGSFSVMAPGNPPPEGLGIIVRDPNNLNAAEQAVISCLRESALEFGIQQGSLPPGGVGLIVTARLD